MPRSMLTVSDLSAAEMRGAGPCAGNQATRTPAEFGNWQPDGPLLIFQKPSLRTPGGRSNWRSQPGRTGAVSLAPEVGLGERSSEDVGGVGWTVRRPDRLPTFDQSNLEPRSSLGVPVVNALRHWEHPFAGASRHVLTIA